MNYESKDQRPKKFISVDSVIDISYPMRSIITKSPGEDLKPIVKNYPPKKFIEIVTNLKSQIEARENPEERIEYWEAQDLDGIFSQGMFDSLLKKRGYCFEEQIEKDFIQLREVFEIKAAKIKANRIPKAGNNSRLPSPPKESPILDESKWRLF